MRACIPLVPESRTAPSPNPKPRSNCSRTAVDHSRTAASTGTEGTRRVAGYSVSLPLSSLPSPSVSS